jgi:hypothetical protein
MAAARKTHANAPAPAAAAPADDAARPGAAPAPDTPPESEAAPGAATSAAPRGAGAPPVQSAAASGYVALRRIRYGVIDAQGQRVSRTYEPGAALDLDDDTAAVLLQSGDVRRA